MALTKSNAELLISRLKQWDLLDYSVCITSQGKRHRSFSTFFSFRDSLQYFSLATIHSQFIKKSQNCLTAQHKQVPLHSFGSFSAGERELRERQNFAKCSQVCPIKLGGHWRLKNGGLLNGAPRMLY